MIDDVARCAQEGEVLLHVRTLSAAERGREAAAAVAAPSPKYQARAATVPRLLPRREATLCVLLRCSRALRRRQRRVQRAVHAHQALRRWQARQRRKTTHEASQGTHAVRLLRGRRRAVQEQLSRV